MATHFNMKLTSAEIASLWSTYLNDTLSNCLFDYFIAKNEDLDILPLLIKSKQESQQHITFITQAFNDEQFPIPIGYSQEKDVFPTAPRIYEDTFFLMFMRQMAKVGMVTYSGALTLAVREDLVEFFHGCLAFTSDLYKAATKIGVQKGIVVRPPYISYPEEVQFVKDETYISVGINPFAHKRALNAIEISHLFTNTETNLLWSMLTTSFAQMAQSKDVRNFMERSREIAKKNITLFSDILVENNMQAPMSWDTNVKNSTTPVFSDKLMMSLAALVSNGAIGNYGIAASASMRFDLGSNYFGLATEAANLGKTAAEIMIKNGWFEEPPHSADREKLIQRKK